MNKYDSYPSSICSDRPVSIHIGIHDEVLGYRYTQEQGKADYVDVAHGVIVCELNKRNSNSSCRRISKSETSKKVNCDCATSVQVTLRILTDYSIQDAIYCCKYR